VGNNAARQRSPEIKVLAPTSPSKSSTVRFRGTAVGGVSDDFGPRPRLWRWHARLLFLAERCPDEVLAIRSRGWSFASGYPQSGNLINPVSLSRGARWMMTKLEMISNSIVS